MRLLILNEFLSIIAGRDGTFLVNRKDTYIGRSIEFYGEHGGLEGAFLKNLVKSGDYVIEVGANIGAHTVGLAKAVGPEGRVDAFEAQRACYALLQAQIALNQLHNVYAYREAAGRANGRLWVPHVNYAEYGNFGGVALSPDQTATSEDVICGAAKLIGRHHPLLYVENDRVGKSKSLVAVLMELGYRLWWHIPKLYNPDNFFRSKDNVYGDVASYNMFCCCGSHPASAGLVEIKSPDEPHPSGQKPFLPSLQYSVKI
jgi:FkbM family methyltransferase